MSTTTQEQNHLPSEELNQNHTNFVKHEKSEANETNLVKNENHIFEIVRNEHDEPKQNQQMPDQSGKSLTEKINADTQNEKLPEQHSNHSNSEHSQKHEQELTTEKQQPKEEKTVTTETHSENKEKQNAEKDNNHPVAQNPEVLHKEENEVTPKTHSQNKENVEKDQNLPVNRNPEIQHDKKLDTDHPEPVEPEIVHKDEIQHQVKPQSEPVEKKTPKHEPEVPHKDENKKEVKPHKDEDKQEAKPETNQPEPIEKQTPQHEPEVVHKDEKKQEVKPDNKHPEPVEPEIVHKGGKKQEVKPETTHPEPEVVHKDEKKPDGKHQEKPHPEENHNNPLDQQNHVQPSSQQNHDEPLENQNPQSEEEEVPKETLEEEKPSTHPQNPPQGELTERINSILNFFSVTKDNIVQSSDQAVAKLGDIISNSKLGSIIQGNEYTPVITSDHIKTQETDPSSTARRRKSSQTDQTPKLRTGSIETPLKVIKSPKKAALPSKTPIGADAKPLLAHDKSLSKLQSPSKQPEFKNRNEIEEQIRQHKIQEIIKQKKALEMKLGSLNEQLVELQKVEFSNSPNRSKSKPKETREEFLERKKKAVEFAKKMNQEQKNIEVRNDQRREARQVAVNKEIEALQQLAEKKYDRKKIMDFIKGQTEVVQKAKYGLSSLEEKKLELKQKREFDKDIDHTRDPSENETPHKLASKSSSKKIYKSPMLPQVLAHDAEVKKVESEKIQKRKALHDKQVEYGRGVKDIFLPKVQSKFEARKLKMGVYKSQQVEAHILRSGKDGLYGYLDKVKNELEAPKYKKKPIKQHREEPAEDDFDRPPTDFADDEEQNVNVAYGKQLVYELQDNWNLADGTLSSRVMSNKNQQELKKNLSPRNPEINSKYAIKQNHLSETEQSLVHAKRTDPRYENDEEDY